ncbi:hypothetical protein ABFX02_13G172500 [Erythranthe guttata]
MSSYKQVEIQIEDQTTPHNKWCHPLKEDGFANFITSKLLDNPTVVHKIFGAGSFFSPLLFGKFFDPSDAFPLWEFESDSLIMPPNLHNSSSHRNIDWSQTDNDFVLRAEIPGNTVEVCIENGKIMEISGQWRQKREWKSGLWWEYGYVRRIELPEQTDWRKTEARVKNDLVLEIKIPKNTRECTVDAPPN